MRASSAKIVPKTRGSGAPLAAGRLSPPTTKRTSAGPAGAPVGAPVVWAGSASWAGGKLWSGRSVAAVATARGAAQSAESRSRDGTADLRVIVGPRQRRFRQSLPLGAEKHPQQG